VPLAGARVVDAAHHSSQDDVEDRVAAVHASYVKKPVLADRLIETVQRVIH
jgi:DNA-binding NarL/FixJ family response regulator